MGHEAKLFALNNLAMQIEGERLKLLGGTPAPGGNSHNELERKIAAWDQVIRNTARDLKSQSHFNHMVHGQERFSANSFAAGQRLKSAEGNVAQLSDALGRVAMALADLTNTLWQGPNGQVRAMEGLKRVLSNWQKAAKHSQDGIMGAAPQELQATVRQIESQMPRGGMPTPGVVDIFTLILSLFVFIKTMNKDRKP